MKHFTIHELTRSATADRKGIDNTPSKQVIENLTALVDNVLDPLREAWGKPIHVNTVSYRLCIPACITPTFSWARPWERLSQMVFS